MPTLYAQHILLTGALILWCVIHSAMISPCVLHVAKNILKNQFKFYRLFYNALAILTLVPILALMLSMPKVSWFEWPGFYRVFELSLMGIGLFFLMAGAKSYDVPQFLGLRQIMSRKHHVAITESGGLHTKGISNVTRHPWYLAGFFVLWARDIDSVSLIVNLVFSAYLIVGTILEEKKLVQEFGQVYIDYQARVSMFFPCKWIAARF